MRNDCNLRLPTFLEDVRQLFWNIMNGNVVQRASSISTDGEPFAEAGVTKPDTVASFNKVVSDVVMGPISAVTVQRVQQE